jgi:hypothetical protein
VVVQLYDAAAAIKQHKPENDCLFIISLLLLVVVVVGRGGVIREFDI